jgi:glycosyltransferase involved in cell wall biosynthesis
VDVTVGVATFGDPAWEELAYRRAIPSAERQSRVVHRHGTTLAEARNWALSVVRSEWVVFLDADDELGPGFVEAMGAATGDLRYPAISRVFKRRATPARCVPPFDIRDGNYLSIGTAVRASLVRAVGGWREWPVLEDWDLWLRCWKAGAVPVAVPEAVYLARKDFPSRSRSAEARRQLIPTFDAIRRANFPELYEESA